MTLKQLIERLTLFANDHSDSPVVNEWDHPFETVYSDDDDEHRRIILLFRGKS